MQGFFGKPVDNLFAEPFVARWIRLNVSGWKDAVVVSKNAGGTKRVTSLADTLKLNFGIVTTDKRRPKAHMPMSESAVFFDSLELETFDPLTDNDPPASSSSHDGNQPLVAQTMQSELATSTEPTSLESGNTLRPTTPPSARRPSELEAAGLYTDVRAKEVITGRFVQGRIVDDDYPITVDPEQPSLAGGSQSGDIYHDSSDAPVPDAMMNSFISTASSVQPEHALGGSGDAADSSDEESGLGLSHGQEKTITLVGEVRNRPVFIVDDMIDKCGSWIAAAETVVKRGGASKVYCIATHGLFGDDSLDEMEACESIDYIVVTNTFPISPSKVHRSKKLVVIDVSSLISEAIRRHHYGERLV